MKAFWGINQRIVKNHPDVYHFRHLVIFFLLWDQGQIPSENRRRYRPWLVLTSIIKHYPIAEDSFLSEISLF